MEKFSKSTFSERKIMSTKTSIKRIAAVAAVALTLGGFSAVSANAAAKTTGNTIVYAWTGDGMTAGNNGTSDTSGGFGFSALGGVSGPVNTVGVRLAAHAGNITAGSLYSSGTSKRSIVTVSGSGVGCIDGSFWIGDSMINAWRRASLKRTLATIKVWYRF
jgi:hypothetical protein